MNLFGWFKRKKPRRPLEEILSLPANELTTEEINYLVNVLSESEKIRIEQRTLINELRVYVGRLQTQNEMFDAMHKRPVRPPYLGEERRKAKRPPEPVSVRLRTERPSAQSTSPVSGTDNTAMNIVLASAIINSAPENETQKPTHTRCEPAPMRHDPSPSSSDSGGGYSDGGGGGGGCD